MNWLALVAQAVDKIPLERLLVRRSDEKERLQDLVKILGEAHSKPEGAEPEPIPDLPEEIGEDTHPANLGNTRPKVHLEANHSVTSTVTTKETVDYQNREIGKNLLMLNRHCIQKFRIAGRACDCGQSKHLLELEALAEETAGMVDNPDIYYRILEWVRRLGPISTVEDVSSGKYDDVYPAFGTEARDLRKELLGTLDPKALFPEKHMKETTALPLTEEVQEITEAEFEQQHKDLLIRGTII